MATTTEPVRDPNVSSGNGTSGNDTQSPQFIPPRPMPARRGGGIARLLGFLVLLGLIGGGGWWYASSAGLLGSGEEFEESTYKVTKKSFLVTVIEDGNLESAKNVDVKCQVAGGSEILKIIEDGAFVNEGDVIVELESSDLEDQINQQKNTYEKARAAKIQAEKDHAVAKISVKEYLEGTFEQDLQLAETQITVAEENLRSAKNSYEFSQKMFRKGYISKLELESQQFNVERSKLELASARTAKDVLVDFTKLKMLEDLNSAVETTQAKMESENAAFDLEESRLKRFEAQLKNCIVKAPQSGMVVYANETSRWGSQSVSIEEGATVRDQQTLIRLPDLSEMQVKVLVHESKIEQLRIGQRATVKLLGKNYDGEVVSVANQPEPTSFFSAGTKEYSTVVRITNSSDKLKPGMTSETEILIARIEDALVVPIASVVEIGGKHLCWVKKGVSYERRELEIGLSNEDVVEIISGIDEGDVVIKNPRRFAEKERSELEARGPSNEKFSQSGGENSGGGPGQGGPSASGEQRGAGQRGGGKPGGGKSGGSQRGGGKADGQTGGQPGSRGGAQGGGGRPAGGGRRGSLMDNDKDGDGKISKDEAPSYMNSFFDRLDANSDGFVDAAEIEKSRKARAAAGGGSWNGGGGQGGGGGERGGGQRGGGRPRGAEGGGRPTQ